MLELLDHLPAWPGGVRAARESGRRGGRDRARSTGGGIRPPGRSVPSKEDFSLIQLITPTTPRQRALRIAERTTGFIYYVSVTGITGERTELPPEIVDNVAWLREQTPLPICIGFGISRPEHVRMLAPVADGLIVGSAIVRRVAETAAKTARGRAGRDRRLCGRTTWRRCGERRAVSRAEALRRTPAIARRFAVSKRRRSRRPWPCGYLARRRGNG